MRTLAQRGGRESVDLSVQEGHAGPAGPAPHRCFSPARAVALRERLESTWMLNAAVPRNLGQSAEKWKLRGSHQRGLKVARARSPRQDPSKPADVASVHEPILHEVPCVNYIGKRGSERAGHPSPSHPPRVWPRYKGKRGLRRDCDRDGSIRRASVYVRFAPVAHQPRRTPVQNSHCDQNDFYAHRRRRVACQGGCR